MLNKTNIIAFVGGGKNPIYSNNKVIIWDNHQGKVISELRFNSSIKNVKLKKNYIIVVLETQIYVFKLKTLEKIDILETYENSKGLIGLSNKPDVFVIAYPIKSKGYVKIKMYDSPINNPIINAHNSNLACLEINFNGTILATASEKGTIIRIIEVSTGNILDEFRRGTENAEIFSISFDITSKFLACSSDKGTIHIFSLSKINKYLEENKVENNKNKNNGGNNKNKNNNNLTNSGNTNNINILNNNQKDDDEPRNQKSFLGKIARIFKLSNEYLDSEWSFAQFRINDEKSICNFGLENTIYVLTNNCKLYQANFNPKIGGDCFNIKECELFKK